MPEQNHEKMCHALVVMNETNKLDILSVNILHIYDAAAN